MSEPAASASGFKKPLNYFQLCLHDGHKYELRDSVARRHREGVVTPIPTGYQKLTLIVGVDQSDEIAEYDSVLVAESGSRKYDGSE